MTEKRYVKENFYDEYAIKKEDTIIAIVDSGTNARKICNELNTLHEENEQLKKDLKSYQSMVEQYINLHIDKIRRRYVNPTREEVAERTRIIRDLEQLKKELHL